MREYVELDGNRLPADDVSECESIKAKLANMGGGQALVYRTVGVYNKKGELTGSKSRETGRVIEG